MGQQQLLLIVLSVIIVGIATTVGINMFSASAASSNLESVTNDLLNYASRAQQYYVKPTGLGGGGNSFAGLTIQDLTAKRSNANGTYSVVSAGATNAVLQGNGVQDGDGDETDVQVQVTVFADSISTSILNY